VDAIINKPLSLEHLQFVMGQLIGGGEEGYDTLFAEMDHN
jgi:hypothetical protein